MQCCLLLGSPWSCVFTRGRVGIGPEQMEVGGVCCPAPDQPPAPDSQVETALQGDLAWAACELGKQRSQGVGVPQARFQSHAVPHQLCDLISLLWICFLIYQIRRILRIKSYFTGWYESAHGELPAGPRNDAQRVRGECDSWAVQGGGAGGRREPGRGEQALLLHPSGDVRMWALSVNTHCVLWTLSGCCCYQPWFTHVDAELSQVKRTVPELVTGCSQDRGPGLPDSEVPVLLESEDVPSFSRDPLGPLSTPWVFIQRSLPTGIVYAKLISPHEDQQLIRSRACQPKLGFPPGFSPGTPWGLQHKGAKTPSRSIDPSEASSGDQCGPALPTPSPVSSPHLSGPQFRSCQCPGLSASQTPIHPPALPTSPPPASTLFTLGLATMNT